MLNVSGRSHKKLNEPSEIIIERRKFRSIISPNIKPNNNGAKEQDLHSKY